MTNAPTAVRRPLALAAMTLLLALSWWQVGPSHQLSDVRMRGDPFTARYELAVLAAYDAAEDGEKGAILRRKCLYSSHIVDWGRARDAAPRGAAATRPAR